MRKLSRNSFTGLSAFIVHGPRFGGGKKLTLDDELYTLEEAVEALGVTESELRRMAEAKDAPHINFGGVLFFPVQDIDAMPKAVSTYEGPAWTDILPIEKISRLRKQGMTPAAIAKELLVSIRVVRKYLEGTGETPLRVTARRSMPSVSGSEYIQAVLRPSGVNEMFLAMQYMHLNKFTPWDIAVTLDLDQDYVTKYVKNYDWHTRHIKYVKRLDPDAGVVVKKAIRAYSHGDYDKVAEEYGVSSEELSKFVVAHKNRWKARESTLRPIFAHNPRIHRNPFTIRDGFQLFGSVSGRDSISIKEDLLTLTDVPGHVPLSVDEVRLLIEFDMIPHIVFGGVPFIPFEELAAVTEMQSEGELRDRVRWARHFKSLEKNPAPTMFPLMLGVGVGLIALGWWLSRRPT